MYADCRNFVNADLIAQGLSPFAPEAVAFRAGRLMLSEIALLAQQQVDFGFETTLSGRGHLHLIRNLKNQVYKVHFFFLWASGVDLTLSRIKDRVAEGGHNVPEPDVRRRFERSIRNFLSDYRPLANSWVLFDSLTNPPSIIALEQQSELRIMKAEEYRTLIEQYGTRH
jgi:predicted ABC-type ATPase